MKHDIQKKIQGFTLIEIVLYLSISTVMVVLLGGIGVHALSNIEYTKSQEEIQYNAQFMTETIQKIVLDAETIQTPVSRATSSKLILITNDASKNPISIEVVDGALLLQQGSGASETLSGESMYVKAIEFSNVSPPGSDTSSLRVRLTLDLSHSGGLVIPDRETSFYTTINQNYP